MTFDGPVQHMQVQFAPPTRVAAVVAAEAGTASGARRTAARSQSLADLPRGVGAVVETVLPPALAEDSDLVLRLIEIGFVPGEPVRIVAEGFPGREPIAVRLGGTTFALRRFEAEYIRVTLDGSPRG